MLKRNLGLPPDTSIRNSICFVKKPKMYRWKIWFAPCGSEWSIEDWTILKQTINVPWPIGKTFPTNQHKCNLETIAGAVFGSTSGKSSGVPGDRGCDSMTYVHVISWIGQIQQTCFRRNAKGSWKSMQQKNCKVSMKLTVAFFSWCSIPPTCTNLNCPSTYCLEVRATTNLKGIYELIVLSGRKSLSKKPTIFLVTARDVFKHYFVQVTFQTLIPSLPVGHRYILILMFSFVSHDSWWPRCFTRFFCPSWYPPWCWEVVIAVVSWCPLPQTYPLGNEGNEKFKSFQKSYIYIYI